MKIHKPNLVPGNLTANNYENEILNKNRDKFTSYNELLDSSSAITLIDMQGTVNYANDNFCKISKYTLEELIGLEYRMINPLCHSADFVRNLKITMDKIRIWNGQLKNIAKDGTSYWLDTILVPDLNDQGEVFQYLGISADITVRKRMQELLMVEFKPTASIKKEDNTVRFIQVIKDKLFQNTAEDKYSDELSVANQDLFFLKNEKAKISADLVLANQELVFQNKEKEKRANELFMANKELLFQNDEKGKRATELILANQELSFQNEEKGKRAAELIIANQELSFQNEEKGKRAAELIIANQELSFQNEEKGKRAAELVIANQELAHQNQEKEKRAIELQEANKELVFQNEEKGKRAVELSEALDRLILLASIADNIQDPVFSVDENLNITRWNAAAERLLEWKSEEVLGKNLEMLLKIDYPDGGMGTIFECLSKQNSWQGEAIYYTKSGSPMNMLVTASYLRDVNSRITGSLFLLRDITPRIKSEKLYRGLFEHMMHGFAYCRPIIEDGELLDYTYLAVNSAYEKLLGLKNISGKSANELFPGLFEMDPLLFHQFSEIALKSNSVKFEHYFQQIKKWVSFSLYSIEEGSFVILMDSIEERKLAEQKLKNLNNELEEKVVKRTEELEAFSYSVSHDLRAPLRAIDGYAQMLKEDYAHLLNQEGKRFIDTIQHNANNMGALIDDLLAFSRLGRKEVTKSIIDMTDLVENVREEITKIYPHKADIKINSLHPVNADYTLMNQVISNLLSNAIKYSLWAKHPMIEVSSQQKGAELVYSIKDNGAGFDMQYVHKLYGVFQRLHSAEEFEGTGVGLAIVKRIIEKQGGKVWAEGKEGQGAVFYFSLPGS